MDRKEFERRLRAASVIALELGGQVANEPLPAEVCYRAKPITDRFRPAPSHQRVFLRDHKRAREPEGTVYSPTDFASELWRDGWVPAQVRLVVNGVENNKTRIAGIYGPGFVPASSCFADPLEEHPPFVALNWSAAFSARTRRLRSQYTYAQIADPSELPNLAAHASEVRGLTLYGQAIDDNFLFRLPAFPRLTNLTFHATPVLGPGLAALSRHPQLDSLDFKLGREQAISLEWLSSSSLRCLLVREGNLAPLNLGLLEQNLPSLTILDLRNTGEVTMSGRWTRPLHYFCVLAKALVSTHLPNSIDKLHLALDQQSEPEIRDFFESVEQLRCLTLTGCRVSDAFIESLLARLPLEELEVYETVSRECVRRIVERYPNLKITPGPDE